eukprot:8732667-Pyramimonas_sp.AAC.1
MERFGDQAEAGRKGIKVGQYEYVVVPGVLSASLPLLAQKDPFRTATTLRVLSLFSSCVHSWFEVGKEGVEAIAARMTTR